MPRDDVEPPLPEKPLEVIDPTCFSLLALMALAVAERGEPMTYEEIAARLREVGVDRPQASFQKAWHGLPPLRKTFDGRLHLVDDGEYSEWGRICFQVREHLGLTWRQRQPAEPPKPKPIVDDRTPLEPAELHDALAAGYSPVLSRRRLLALLAERSEGSLTFSEAVRQLWELGIRASEADVRNSVRGSAGPLRFGEDGRIVLDVSHPSLPKIRRIARELAAKGTARREEERRLRTRQAEIAARRTAERAERRQWYGQARKAVLRCFPAKGKIVAASVLDPDQRIFEDFADPTALRRRLEEVEIVLGLDPWGDLERLGIPAAGRTLVDLSPPTKTRRLNRAGRVLRIRPEMLLGSTLNTSRPLGEPQVLAGYAAQSHTGKLRRRLRADLKSLWAFYEYGRLHGYVRLRWGFLDELIPAHWNVGRLPTLFEIFEDAGQQGLEVEIVAGFPPAWSDPWSRGQRGRVRELGYHQVVVLAGEEASLVHLDLEEVFAVRVIRP